MSNQALFAKCAQKICVQGPLVTDSEGGEITCGSCGAVLVQNMVDYNAERFSEDFYNSRTGPKTSLAMHDGGLSTIIGKFNVDSEGRPLAYEMKNSLNRMRLWDSRSKIKSTGQQNLRFALIEINKLKEKMGLSDAVIERAAYFYRKAQEKKLIQGRTVRGIVGACMYAACRDMEATRTIIEISKHLNEKRRTIAKSYRLLFQRLSLTVPPANPVKSILRFSNNLKISEVTKREAFRIFDLLKEKGIVAGKKPDAVAATVLYMACIETSENVSKQKIIKTSGIPKITICNRFKEFSKYV